MGQVTRVTRRIVFILSALACIVITCMNADDVDTHIDGTSHLVSEYVPTYYEMLSDNVGLTTINGISNVYLNMELDGYSVYKENITNTSIDVSFIKEGFPSYRYYYNMSDGRITFFCSDYEISYTGLSYINDKKN